MNLIREALGDFIRRTRKEKNLSLVDVSLRSLRLGEPIAASYINRIENDPTRRLTAYKLKPLANGLGVPVEELFARAAGVVAPGRNFDELRLLTRFRELPPERRADILRIVEMWYAQD